MKGVWATVKIGLIPLALIFIPMLMIDWLWAAVNAWGIHPFNNNLIDVPLNIILALFGSYLVGYLFKRPKFQEFAKNYFIKIPVLGGLLLHLIVPKCELRLVEIKTVPGFTAAEENWEYALVMQEAWLEDEIIWYCVHTIGWAGKLFSRVGEGNVKIIPPEKQKEAWVTIISMGLL